MLLTRPAFWYLPDPRSTRCLGCFGPRLDPSLGAEVSDLSSRRAVESSRVTTDSSAGVTNGVRVSPQPSQVRPKSLRAVMGVALEMRERSKRVVREGVEELEREPTPFQTIPPVARSMLLDPGAYHPLLLRIHRLRLCAALGSLPETRTSDNGP